MVALAIRIKYAFQEFISVSKVDIIAAALWAAFK